MYKTKLGISVGLMGALVCFLGLLLGTFWSFLAIVAYILITEDNEWLRRLVLKVLILVIAISVLSFAFSQLDNIFNSLVNLFSDEMYTGTFPNKITSFASTAISVIGDIILFFMGLKALKQGHFAIKSIDDVISKNI